MSDLIADAVHQMNNPLSNIRLATEVLMEEMEEILPGDSQHKEFCTKRLANIIGEVDRARAVIRELGQLARRKSHAKESLDLQSLVERAVRSPGVQIDPDVKIGIEIGDNISIRGDNHLMTTAIANLTSDALHALGGKGRVVFQARSEQDGAVEVTVTVSGTRIPGGNRDEISSPPLFTGKGGKRMGLGRACAREGEHIQTEPSCPGE
ncbi:MAG: HAMP domain-containing sensor histidine kinase [Deltaproteobacteria bacterium]